MAVSKRKKSSGGRWDNVPHDDADLDNGGYEFNCIKAEVAHTRESDEHPERLMYVATFEVVGPESHKGRIHIERFVIGNDEDPEAEELETLMKTPGAKSFKSLCDAMGVQIPDGDEEACEAIVGEKVFGHIEKRANKDTGQVYVNVRRGGWQPVGEEDAYISDSDDKKGGKKAAAKASSAKAKAVTKKQAAKDEDEDEEDEEEEAPAKKRGRPAKAAKKAVEEDDEDEDSDEDEDEDERPAKKRASKKDDDEEEEDDEDEDEDEEDERPRGKRR